MLKLNKFCHNHHPSGEKILTKLFRHGISGLFYIDLEFRYFFVKEVKPHA